MGMQSQRLFEIIYVLQNGKSRTAGQLAERFGVSVRTVLRDVETLSAAGVPIYTVQGKGGGIALLDGYVLDKTTLSQEEQSQLLFALQSIAAAGQGEAAATLGKLQALFAREEANWIEVDFSRWGASEEDKRQFALLKQSILKRQAIRFTYSGASGQTEDKTVWPLKMVFKGQAWYLQAYAPQRQSVRTYKICRMHGLAVTGEVYPPQPFAIPSIEGDESSPPHPLLRLSLWVAPALAYRAYDEFGLEQMVLQEDGSLLVQTRLLEDEWMYQFLLSFGTGIRVLAPPHVARELCRRAQALVDAYSAPGDGKSAP